MTEIDSTHSYDLLYSDTCKIIEEARNYAYRAINVALTLRNWRLGERIARESLDGAERAEYGKKIITELSQDLTNKFGKGFDKSTLYRYILFYRMFPNIVAALRPQLQTVGAASQQSENVAAPRPQFGVLAATSPKLLPWTHYRELIRVDDADAREWYEQEALREMWSTRTLHRNISSQYYYRLMRSGNKEKVTDEMHRLTQSMQQDKLQFMKNPVVAEFLGLQPYADFIRRQNWRVVSSAICKVLSWRWARDLPLWPDRSISARIWVIFILTWCSTIIF